MAIVFAVAVPFMCLALLMGMARLEETLADGLDNPKATREPVFAADAVPATIEVSPAPAAATAAA